MIDSLSCYQLEENSKYIESIASSLIREFLARKGLKHALEILDCDLPRDAYSTNNRAELIRVLHLQNLVAKNKHCHSSSSTLLEIITKKLLEHSVHSSISGNYCTGIVRSSEKTAAVREDDVQGQDTTRDGLSPRKEDSEILKHSSHRKILGGTCNFKKPVGLCSPNISAPQSATNPDHERLASSLGESTKAEEAFEIKELIVERGVPIGSSLSMSTSGTNDIEVCDFSDSDMADLLPISPSRPMPKTTSRPILLSEACALKKLMFGSTFGGFSFEWRGQAFTFSPYPPVAYGLVQKKGGPCGLLSAVQSHILRELLFSEHAVGLEHGRLRVTRESRSRALARSLAYTLWQAGGKQRAIVALPSKIQVLDCGTQMKADGITETLSLANFTMYSELESFLQYMAPQLELDGTDSCITILYSAVMSRGIDRVTSDMDDPTTNLVGRHGYCTQEMVNLLLIGQAVSNVFDGNIELNAGGIDRLILHGIPGPSDIGFLSLFEHYDSCKVGSFYKNSRYPIWLVLSESHFTVLFAVLREITREDVRIPFDLFYYDSLGHQEEEIWLTVDPSANFEHPPNVSDLTPPLEHCIRTKWKGARVTWHGSDPLL